jgi:hypothetical protein
MRTDPVEEEEEEVKGKEDIFGPSSYEITMQLNILQTVHIFNVIFLP